MKTQIHLVQIAIVTLLLSGLISCSKQIDFAHETNNGLTIANKQLSGSAWLVDQYGKLLTDNSGITVHISNGSYQQSVQTSADGSYSFSNVPADAVLVSFSKAGYATNQTTVRTNEKETHVMVPAMLLGKPATHQIFIRNARIASGALIADIDAMPAAAKGKPAGYRMFVNNAAVASHTQFTHQYAGNTENGHQLMLLTAQQLQQLGFSKGQTLSLTIYPDTFNATMGLQQGLPFFPTLNTAAAQNISIQL